MPLTTRFAEALAYACEVHAGQSRKGSDIPYVSHLLSVTAIVLEHGGSEDEAIAAVLHDAIEDGGGAVVRDEIARRFGRPVAEIVDGCTDADTTPKPPWRHRKEKHLAHIRTADRSVRLVVAADKLHNVRSLIADYRVIGELLWDRFSGGKAGTLWYYQEMTTLLGEGEQSALVDELKRAVAELQRMVAASS